MVIGATEKEVQDRLAWIRSHYESVLTAEQAEQTTASFANSPLAGTPEQIVERLREMNDLGMTYTIVYFAEAAYDQSGIELFAKEVVPALA